MIKSRDLSYAAEIAALLDALLVMKKEIDAKPPDEKRAYKRRINIELVDDLDDDPLSGFVHAGIGIDAVAIPRIRQAMEKFCFAEFKRLGVEWAPLRKKK